MPSIFRGGQTATMVDEFELYGLDNKIMIIVGVIKVLLALLLLLGAIRFHLLVKPSAGIMALFMIGAVYFHISVGDGIVPTLPAASMLLSCLLILFLESKIFLKSSPDS